MRQQKPWTEQEDTIVLHRRASGATWDEIAAELGRSADSVTGRTKYLRRTAQTTLTVVSDEEPTPKDVKQEIHNASLRPPVDTTQGDKRRIHELESENSRLREQLTWAQNADSKERTGGLLTLRRSDDHHVDKNHLLSCAESLTQKFLVLVKQYEPDQIQILAGDDWIAGKGVYKQQDLDVAVSDLDGQLCVGAIKVRRFLEAIRSVSNAPIVFRTMRGNHSFVQGESVTEALFDRMMVTCIDIPEVQFTYHWDNMTINLAAAGTYNVLVRHGFGYSKNAPNSPAFVQAVKDELLVKQKNMQPQEQYRRVLSGHTHWQTTGMEQITGLFFDTTGGLQRNTRIRIGDNQRPAGWIVYVSPRDMDSDILQPIGITPDHETYQREIADPHLAQANCDDASECLREYRKLREDRGEFAEASSFGKLNEGSW
jgi:hypothetical protein